MAARLLPHAPAPITVINLNSRFLYSKLRFYLKSVAIKITHETHVIFLGRALLIYSTKDEDFSKVQIIFFLKLAKFDLSYH